MDTCFLCYRPIAGHVNFCPDMLAQSNTMSDTFMISLIQHEILHTLVSVAIAGSYSNAILCSQNALF